MLGHNDPIPPEHDGPIFCCMRAMDLEARIAECPEGKRNDLIFVQNGYINPVLAKFDLLESATRVILFIGVPSTSSTPIDGVTELHPNGLTVVSGKWAREVKNRLAHHNLSCTIVDYPELEKVYYEKIIWLCTFNLIGMCHGGMVMAQVANQKEKLALQIMLELFSVVQQRTSVQFDIPYSMQKLMAYARTLLQYPTSFSEYETRNAYFYDHSKAIMAQGLPDPSPTHTQYVEHFFAVVQKKSPTRRSRL